MLFDLVPQFGGLLIFDRGLDRRSGLFYFFFQVGDPFLSFFFQVGDLLPGLFQRTDGQLR
jgi:hypothetical protein